ncbi:MAG: Response regulator receiver protein [Chthoniobacteraceae bacterium]|nr:Response regulator receiver protein [Chthoniobacteraceae bacterium]MDB6174629.1 Response regulator receiver protein [Chthoniobacteraceae bacterium]
MAARQKILILDDEHDILEIYQEILARLPSAPEIHTADNGARAIALLESAAFNLLLIDLRMPQMDGFQVLVLVRRKFPSLRVIVMTAGEDEQFRARAYAMGIDLYMEKPKTGKEIINFVDCIESLLEREDRGGFRGVQSKTLVDIVQLECFTQSSAILKVTTSVGEGRIWLQRGEIIDASTGDMTGREAFLEMMRWKAGNFELLASDLPRPRTIFSSYESLLMETAQTLDETAAVTPSLEEAGLGAFGRFKGVQFAVSVQTTDKNKFDQWGMENPEQMASWIHETSKNLRNLGDKLVAGQLERFEGLGPQRHIAVLSGDEQSLGIGFTRSAVLPHIRETMKQIESKWLS